MSFYWGETAVCQPNHAKIPEFKRAKSESKLPPDADAQLHIVVADLVAGADAMKAAMDAKAGRAGLIQVDVYTLKKKSTDVADVVTFIKTLSQWRSIPVRYDSSAGDHEGHITNMHFMKRPFYAADMGFPEPIAPNSGTFGFSILNAVSNMDLAKRFSQVLLFKNFEQGRHATMEVPWIRIESNTEIPFEMDGEVVWGKNFSLRCVYAGVRLCL